MKRFCFLATLLCLCGCGNPTAAPVAPTVTSTSTAVTPPPVPPPPQALLTPALKAQIIGDIEQVGGSAVDLALAAASQANGALVGEIATALKINIETTVLPVLNGQNVTPSAAEAAVANNLYVKINPLVTLGLQAAAAILSTKYSIPGVQESDKVDFIRAFVKAIDDGCTQYIASPPPIGKTMKKHVLRDL